MQTGSIASHHLSEKGRAFKQTSHFYFQSSKKSELKIISPLVLLRVFSFLDMLRGKETALSQASLAGALTAPEGSGESREVC